ncbi:hypothetical protein [Daejeonella sp.]|uniref:hypothetical protein n=1 Tax=Daejeonella sp. TaxID=2805397 RepID=UPI0039833E4B
MTYHHNITQYRSLRNTRLWTERIFLSLLILSTSAIAWYNSTALNLYYALPGLVFIIVIAMLVIRRRRISFIDITDGTLSYLDTDKGEMVSVPVHDITHISTRFCQLNVHTSECIHTLNLDMVRNEKTRWEIKEMIRQSARQARAVA